MKLPITGKIGCISLFRLFLVRRYIDWTKLIAERMHEGLSYSGNKNFYMSSYLMYCLSCICQWTGLFHEVWQNDMRIYEYYPHLQQHRVAENYYKVQKKILGRIVFELRGDMNKRLTEEAMQFISTYGSFYIQFSRFTYLRVGGFEGEPYKLSRYVFDRQVLMEVSRQLAYIEKKYREKHQTRVSFPIELTYYTCNSVSYALNLELEFKQFNFILYVPRTNFDIKGFAMAHLIIREHFQHMSNLDDFWVDCEDEYEVWKRAHLRFTVQKVRQYGLEMDTAHIVDNGKDLIDSQFVEDRQLEVIPEINWEKNEEEDIQTRTLMVIRKMEKWLKQHRLRESR